MAIILLPISSNAATDYTADGNCTLAYQLEEASGAPSNACGTDGTVAGDPTESVTGAYSSNAWDFDGTDDHFYNTYANITSSQNCICAWIELDDNTGIQSIISGDNTSTGERNFQFRANGTSLDFIIFVSNSPYTNSHGTALNTNATFVCARFDGSTIYTYINGAQSTGTTRSGSMDNDNPVVSIAARIIHSGSKSAQDFLDGVLDELIIFNVAMTSTDVNNILTNGIDGSQGASDRVITIYSQILINKLKQHGVKV